MTQPDQHIPSGQHASTTEAFNSASSLTARIVWTILIVATLYLCYFHNLRAIGFVGPDEPRYAWIARDMVESGDWVTPRLYGKPWFEKPILYYWGAAASFKLFGVGEAAARLPSAICALLATLSMAWLAWKLYGAETARWLLLLFPTTLGMIGFSHAAATDMPFAGTLTVAMVFAAVIVGLTRNDDSPVLPRTPWLALICFGFFLGLAVLAKGPAAIILSGSAILIWARYTKRWPDALLCLHPAGIASFCATALPWYILCARRNPDFLRVFIIEHNFKRFLTPEFQHIQPFWYYSPVLLVALLPWTLALFTTSFFACQRLWRGQRFSTATIYLASWAAFCVVFFSISRSKLPGYILPAIPAIVLVLAKSYVQMTSHQSRLFRWIQLGGGALFVAMGGVLFLIAAGGSTGNPGADLAKGFVIVAIGIPNILLGIRRRRTFFSCQLSSFCAVPLLLLLCFFYRLGPHFLALDPSGKAIAREIVEKQIPVDQMYIANMRRGQQYGLNFYLHYETQQWNAAEQKEGYLLLSWKGCSQLVQSPLVCSDEPRQLESNGWYIYRVQRQN